MRDDRNPFGPVKSLNQSSSKIDPFEGLVPEKGKGQLSSAIEPFNPMMREHQLFDSLNRLTHAIHNVSDRLDELAKEKEPDTIAGLLSEDTKELIWQHMENQVNKLTEVNYIRMSNIISRTIEEFCKSSDDAYNLSLACYVHILAVSLYSDRQQ
ncbi:hypothetical protein SP15_085 [Bacillus phage SP-15]|uniref:Uncharacterized protein n=1 Tax=Bacillus phage SP-15 TaxID=1792032 RepID=A0A127AX82_9CAUD|nr:hypothetical protein SP15_085 [Bacillus phage SP-15]AMM44884.1 hypothetical protein SP15_085 [Bacillus phage SP-15]